MRFTPLFVLLLLALAAYGYQTTVAVLPSDGTVLTNDELEVLTDKMREAALKVLPTNAFVLVKQDVVVKRLGGAENFIKECKESTCIVNLGKLAQVDYVAQASVGKLGNKIRLKVELYNVSTEGLIGMLSDEESENIMNLLAIVEKRVPTEVFSKILSASGSSKSPLVADGEKSHSNFGVLEIRPAYLDGIGSYDDWNLSINDKLYRSFENKFSPGNYNVKLSHRCYEPISFMAGINKDSREVFDMAYHIKLKKGGLALSAEKNGKPASEPVFVNGKRVGDTPFGDAVPLCSKIEIGNSMEVLNVDLKYNENVKYVYKFGDAYSSYTAQKPGIEKSSRTSFWVAIGLEALGAIIIYNGYVTGKDAYDDYKKIDYGRVSKYGDAWEKVESKNTFYVIGGLILASGIGVHIWF